PGLKGQYLFGDYASGNVWAIDLHASEPKAKWLAGRAGLSTFGLHPGDGGVLVANHLNGKIDRLIYTPPDQSPVQRSLREVNAFADLKTLKPASGMVPFEVINPLWSDGALKQRWVDWSRASGTVGFQPSEAWLFPAGMVWMKHFELEQTNGSL